MSILIALDSILSAPASSVGRAISANINRKSRNARHLIVRPGGLGDLVVATAALESLGYDPHEFDWIVERRSVVWATQLGLNHWCYDSMRLRERFRQLATRSLCINLEQRYGLSAAFSKAMLSREGKLFGFDTNLGASLYDSHVVYDSHDRHELLSFRDLFASALGAVAIPVRQRERVAAPESYTVVALAGTGAKTRSWSSAEWVELIERFVFDDELVISAAPSDATLASAISARLGTRVRFTADTWERTCAAVKVARRVFTVDGGMVHVASYFGVPVDAVFTAGRDRKWMPWSKGSRVIKRSDLPCQPCTLFGRVPKCDWQYQCMRIEHARVSELNGSLWATE